jgi:hypothetical protein
MSGRLFFIAVISLAFGYIGVVDPDAGPLTINSQDILVDEVCHDPEYGCLIAKLFLIPYPPMRLMEGAASKEMSVICS